MGNSASKGAAQAAGKAIKRQYPTSPSSSLLAASQAPAQQQQQQQQVQHSQQPPERPRSGVVDDNNNNDDFVDLDARDPHFASSLSRVGPVRRTPEATRPSPQSPASLLQSQPSPSQSQSQSSFYSPDEAPPTGQNVFPSRSAVTNPAIAIVNARDRIAQQFEEELEGAGRKGFAGRSLLSASEIREVIGAKEQGRWADGAIEKQFRLRSGVLAQILSAGVVKNV